MIRQSEYSRQRLDEPSIGTLLKCLTDGTRNLFRKEVELAKAELGEKASIAGRNVGYLVAGGAVAYAGILALVAAACVGLAIALGKVMDPDIAAWLGPVIVGVVVALIGYALLQKAISTLRRESFVPRQTVDSLRENTQWFKEQIKTTNRMSEVESPTR